MNAPHQLNRKLCVSHLFLATATVACASPHSALWGEHGEKWTPQSRLPDFSFAGCHCGEQPLPETKPGVSVKEFGAKEDGEADDTQAFLDALAKVEKGTVEIPPGRYRLTKILEITKPGLVLRGAGPDKTTLFFPVPLNDIRPDWGETTTGQRTSNYSWSGGFIWMRGNFGLSPLTKITGDAQRGDTAVRVAAAAVLRAGQRVEIHQSDTPNNSLAVHLYSGDSGPVKNLRGRTQTSLVCRVTSIAGDMVHLDRPLRCDLRGEWKPEVRRFEPSVTGCGVESLTFEFPDKPYRGHFTELGSNALAMSGVSDCRVRHIRIRNADSGIFISGHFNTVDDVVLESVRAMDGQQCTGHHGVSLGGGDNLVTGFDFRTRFIHDITVSHHCAGNVCANGRGVDLALDHHRYAPYENLFTDIDAGAGRRLWKCGGGADLGYHCGARGTFWNIRSQSPLNYPPRGFGPDSMNLIALQTTQAGETTPGGKWFETIPPDALEPKNLHAAQIKRRLGAK